MAANLRTSGVSGFVRAPVQHDRLGDVEAENLTREAIAANSNFIERLIASGRMGTREVARFASAWFGLPLPDRNAADPAPFPGDALDRKRVQRGGCHFPRGDGRDELLRGGPRRHVAAPAPGGARSLRGHRLQGPRRHFPGDAGFRIGRIILRRGSAVEPAEQTRLESVLDPRQAGLLKVKQGLTSLEEVTAVTNE